MKDKVFNSAVKYANKAYDKRTRILFGKIRITSAFIDLAQCETTAPEAETVFENNHLENAYNRQPSLPCFQPVPLFDTNSYKRHSNQAPSSIPPV